MADLRSMLQELGCNWVATYIQSGNAILRAEIRTDLAAAIERLFASRFGFASRVMLRDIAWLRRLVAENPFSPAEPTKLHAYVLERSPELGSVARLAERKTGNERLHVVDDVLYLFTPDGYGSSKLAAAIPAVLGIACTARNWRTMLRLLEIAEGVESSAN